MRPAGGWSMIDSMDANTQFMRRAIELSRHAIESGDGGPFGAVIVRENRIVGEGWNRVLVSNDPTAHAEVVAIRHACQNLGTFQLKECTLYTSCEPCPMCLAAAFWARLGRVYFANDCNDAKAAGFDDACFYEHLSQDKRGELLPHEQLLRDEAWPVFQQWIGMGGKRTY